jgi:Secretion system C-terminal sorting domain
MRRPYYLPISIGYLCMYAWVLLVPALGRGQSNIGGVINSYFKVTAINTVQSSLDVSSTTGISLFDYVMIIQMKGAVVNTSNNSSFGTVTSYNDAGNYEINVICGIEPTRVFMLNKLSKTYDPVNGDVQIVRMPSYNNATVVSTLQAQPWDPVSGTGGVLAAMVLGTLTMQSNIDATDDGYNGGAFKLLNGACSNFFSYTDYFYNTNAITNGGNYKGEGIADMGVNYSGGRGPIANGGGGGNDHNTGGAGGGNLAAGGNGGNNASSVGCRGNFPGFGSLALNNAGNRIYMGGGGGTGHANNGGTTGGANGGGIVYIKATEVIGNSYTIAANGSKGSSSIGDGASGAGGGGTIILDVTTYTGSVNVEAKGGSGGDEDNLNIAGRCYGTGGGGGGGVIYYTGAIPGTATNSAAGGPAGISSSGNPSSCNGVTGATAGANGSVNASYTVSVSNTPETYCNILLSSKYIALTVSKNNNDNAVLKWKLQGIESVNDFTIEKSTDGLVWKAIGKINFQNGLLHYLFTDPSVNTAGTCYRISALLPAGTKYYSNVTCANYSGNKNWLLIGNPVHDFLYINGLPQQPVHIELYDASGKMMQQYNKAIFTQPLQLNVSTLSKGIYYVRCNGSVKPFVKN